MKRVASQQRGVWSARASIAQLVGTRQLRGRAAAWTASVFVRSQSQLPLCPPQFLNGYAPRGPHAQRQQLRAGGKIAMVYQPALRPRARRRAFSGRLTATTNLMQTAGGKLPRRWTVRFEFSFRTSKQNLAPTGWRFYNALMLRVLQRQKC